MLQKDPTDRGSYKNNFLAHSGLLWRGGSTTSLLYQGVNMLFTAAKIGILTSESMEIDWSQPQKAPRRTAVFATFT